MISLKISISVQRMAEIKTKIKLESDSAENSLPFENLRVEVLPSETEGTDLRLQFINFNTENKQSTPFTSLKKSWWKRFSDYYLASIAVSKENNQKEPGN